MKIEQLIVQYLYNNKHVTFQGIGTIRLNPDMAMPSEGSRDFVMPENAFAFEYNLKAVEDDAMVDFIVQQTKKIKPLASADLDSYLVLAKQFLNMGKPLVIEGVGSIQKNQSGEYEFFPGQLITPKIDDIPKQVREKRDESVSFESISKTNNSRRNLLLSLASLLILLLGLSMYYFLSGKKTPNTAQLKARPDTIHVDSPKANTLDSIAKLLPVAKNDSINFHIVINEYTSREAAQNAFDKLTSYKNKLVIISVDSPVYKLAMPFKTPLSDTLRARDSLRKIFDDNLYIELKK